LNMQNRKKGNRGKPKQKKKNNEDGNQKEKREIRGEKRKHASERTTVMAGRACFRKICEIQNQENTQRTESRRSSGNEEHWRE